ncbi:hypothetical protein PIB30_109272, partial [Stylosanthes scabra]|nr:hypothetical protein [Stylosanthes scabra]
FPSIYKHTKEEKSNTTSFSKKKTILPVLHICMGLAVLWAIAASSTHKRGLPRLCLASTHVRGLENVGKKLSFHAYALLRRMCVALKTLGRSFPSTHMRAVLRICVALGRAS